MILHLEKHDRSDPKIAKLRRDFAGIVRDIRRYGKYLLPARRRQLERIFEKNLAAISEG